ncbi:hypothetical protein Aph01nite_59250 [Acrocarpospora phusangensis]|uniref:Uncharacterized protein n=1 Tax=Acrocarpospora phusangensis TaxID=1070424 RepID=A0A919QHQ7_9ACTN|nr:hypothetical protein [Acrocarpospora phusangensis]GIH27615.1 hypothetical protein Aph01nite_59250 [Acrocarpospora phusangensis]
MTKTAYKVVGPHPVAGICAGETVQLDDQAVNIPALIAGGHIEILKRPATTKTETKVAEEVAA